MPRALLFDLFGTVVQFKPQVPTVEVAGTAWRSTMGWLRETAEHELPHVAVRRSAAGADAGHRGDRPRAAARLSRSTVARTLPPRVAARGHRRRERRRCAERLSLAHMAHLASMTVLPPEHVPLLNDLARRYPLALVSNFDHGPTARRVLSDHGIAGFFPTTVISAEFGRRKPHPADLRGGLAGRPGSSADDALFIGDSIGDDVVGRAPRRRAGGVAQRKERAAPVGHASTAPHDCAADRSTGGARRHVTAMPGLLGSCIPFRSFPWNSDTNVPFLKHKVQRASDSKTDGR